MPPMPSQITGNLYATVIAMAEKASDMILKLEKKTPWKHKGNS